MNQETANKITEIVIFLMFGVIVVVAQFLTGLIVLTITKDLTITTALTIIVTGITIKLITGLETKTEEVKENAI